MRAFVLGLIILLPIYCAKAQNGSRSGNHPGDSSFKKNTTEKGDSTGRYLIINRIFITGNRVTRDQIILRELSLKTGDIMYSLDLPEILDKDRKKIFNTRLFNTVEIRTLELEAGKIDLLIDLSERWYTFPAPIFELSDRNFNEWWQNYDHDFRRVNYGLRLYQYNMRGRNESLRLTAQLGFQRTFNLVYRFPYIDQRQKHGLVIDLDYSETKNLAYRTFGHKLEFLKSRDILRTSQGGSITYTYRNSFYDIHSVELEHRLNEVNDTIPALNSNYYGVGQTRQEYTVLSYQYSHDHRDIAAYPQSGHYFLVTASKLGLSRQEDVNKTEITSSYARYIKMKRGFLFSNLSLGYWSTPQDIPYSIYGALGYRKLFVRGYEIYVIEGPCYALNKMTLKKLIFSDIYRYERFPVEQFRHLPISIYAKIYADVGYVKNYPNYPLNTELSDRLLTGVGGGLDIVGSYDAVIRLEYSFNTEGRGGFFFHVKKEF